MSEWRTDVENCPNDRPFLVADPTLFGEKPSKYSYHVVEWTPIHRDLNHDDPNQEYKFAYDYDYEYGCYYCCDNFEYWMEIPEI